MDRDRPLFILAGNGPYENRGCEAIVRGTIKILKENFQDPRIICISHFQSENQFRDQCIQETDKTIIHLTSCLLSKKKVIQNLRKQETWSKVFQYFFSRGSFYYGEIFPYLNDASAVLSVGGDNYSLDYGVPTLFTTLDDFVLAHKRPLVIWGASIGPFSTIPGYENYISEHLMKVNGIFARESVTIEYLKKIGIQENVFPVADPAFILDPIKPEGGIIIEKDSIGLNFSPLMAKFVTGGNLEQWTELVGSIITEVANTTEKHIYLIPHVTTANSNDHAFMQKALSLVSRKRHFITIIPPRYTAAETKWIISQMATFAGARTHATIAALSSNIPTLCFSYSAKAQGINQDIFGHTKHCINTNELEAKKVAKKISSMMDENKSICTFLKNRIPKIQFLARNAGLRLQQLIKES